MNKISTIIVEDDVKISKIHSMFVDKIVGFEVVAIANSIEDAHSMITLYKPDLLLLDLYFPEGNGLDLLKRLRDENTELDVILITAAKEVTSLQKALRSGVFDYLIKPVIFERFNESLTRFEAHYQKMKNQDHVEQSDVDGFFHVKTTSDQPASQDMPKGIDPLTLKKVREVFNEIPEGITAEKAGELVGASRSTARRYLEYLVSIGLVYADQEYGTVGRPERVYYMKKPTSTI